MTLEVKNINKHYGAKQVLKNISFEATSGRAMGLLGRNGHGKSTTMKILMGIIAGDDREQISLDGRPLRLYRIKFGYLPEERGLYPKVPVLEQMVYFGRLRGMTADEAKKSSTDFLEKLEMTEYIKKKANALSKGNQQKIQLAIALLNNPDIIILDEPFSGLDPINAKMMQDVITENAQNNKIIIFSSHQMAQVEEFCQDICIIKHGEVMVKGSLQEIKHTYPKNKILVTAELGEEDKLKTVLDGSLAPFIVRYDRRPNGDFILRTTHDDDKNRIVNRLITSGVSIDAVSVLRPTLLEIFLEKAGEETHEGA